MMRTGLGSRYAAPAAAAIMACAYVLFAAAPARAAGVVCDVLCIWATNSEEGVDPALKDVEELKKPPFAGYKGYKVISNPKLDLADGGSGEAPLTEVYKLRITYKGIVGTAPNEKLSVHLLVPPKKLETTLASPSGKRFFISGLTHKDGILILGITCTKK